MNHTWNIEAKPSAETAKKDTFFVDLKTRFPFYPSKSVLVWEDICETSKKPSFCATSKGKSIEVK